MSLPSVALLVLLADADPKVEFGPVRKVSVLPMGHCDIDVVFRLVIHDAGSEDYYCPRIEWQWEDGSISEEESDCPPWAEAAADDHRQVWTRRHAFQKSGRYVIRARLYKADRLVRILETPVVITGWTGFADERRQENGCSPARSPALPPPKPIDLGKGPPGRSPRRQARGSISHARSAPPPASLPTGGSASR
jgi:hypothetical protein